MSVQELTLDQLGTVSRGRSRHRPRNAAFLYGGDYPFVQTGDVKRAGLYLKDFEQTYSEEGLAQSKLWPAGTLCITIAANIAETSILEIEACFPDSVIGFNAYPDKADTRFVKYLFDAVLKMRFQSFTQGAAQDNLSCCSARGLRAARHDKLLKWLDTGGQNCTLNNSQRRRGSGNWRGGTDRRGRDLRRQEPAGPYRAHPPGPARRFRYRRRCHRLLRQERHSGMRLTAAGGRDRGLAADSDLERHGYSRFGNRPITI